MKKKKPHPYFPKIHFMKDEIKTWCGQHWPEERGTKITHDVNLVTCENCNMQRLGLKRRRWNSHP